MVKSQEEIMESFQFLHDNPFSVATEPFMESPVLEPFKFSEGKLLDEIREYVLATYGQHYAKGIQVTEFIMSNLESYDFLKGNILKYTVRYGRKNGHNRKDLLKIVHYALLLLHFHDLKEKK